MPLFLRHTEPFGMWGIWKTEETIDELLALLPHDAPYRTDILRFGALHRRQEWLAVRMLLYTLLGEEKTIAYLSGGKPYLSDHTHTIGISHTGGYVAVIVGAPRGNVSIDIEQYGERVHRVAHKFMRPDESVPSYCGTDTWSLLLHWSAKETLFKSLNTPEVDFREHLRIMPFEPSASGTFAAREYRTPQQRQYTVYYRIFEEFVLTWINEEENT
ncbi:MAG: 4'-phosphopantetheinyl transferase superfamily protein [Mediterranea sp.]|jgi:4'-phosphopantetheinyl transferase EntD|nr:4'-phosphopantetheinyl transferase superfamily protein [Mediterranea sp.]